MRDMNAPRTERSPEEERQHRKRQLAATLRIFARLGFDEGAGGHVTARDPIRPDHFWINRFGQHFGHVRVSDLLLVDHAGTVVAGTGTINPAGYAIHSQIHLARPDVVAAAHTHSTYGRAWSTLGRPLDPITQDACAFFEDHEVHEHYSGVVLDPAEGKRIAGTLGDRKAVVLRNHGLLTVGGSVAEAAWWFVSMDRCCQVQLLAEAAGRPVMVDPDDARATRDTIGTPGLGRLNFRPLYADVVRAEPDLLD
ncbi:class II aldolase/adducin family protein [Micromonospora echinaurantiaca]|uniref:class II aldolase/adducin family protein n=1 Tax=Micromonospora echinaurantiaca TaxID=47857 RepID=UPI0034483F2E